MGKFGKILGVLRGDSLGVGIFLRNFRVFGKVENFKNWKIGDFLSVLSIGGLGVGEGFFMGRN